jgi:hypothetical protein
MFVHAIPQVTPERRGIHVLWAGPTAWLYSPVGWVIQRRVFERAPPRLDCVRLSDAELDRLRTRHELTTRLGALTLRRGPWLAPVAAPASAAAASAQAEIITLTLAAAQSTVRVEVAAKASFAVALRDGRVVAGGAVLSGNAAHPLSAPEIDTIVVYALGLVGFGFCVQPDDLAGWRGVPIAKRLQLPIRELMPTLATPALEFAEATSRLLPGEELDRDEFESLTEMLRLLVGAAGPPRPIDLALLMRETADQDPQELCALDPIRAALIHPRWRRVLGFAWFDDDPSLAAGAVYEYRVTGGFPAVDLAHRVVGLHTVPSHTALPSEWYLGGIRLRFPQPCVVERAAPDNGARRQITRRGVRMAPKDQPWWAVPSLDDWSLVIDFPVGVSSVTLDLEPGHALKFASGAPWLPPSAAAPLPPGPRVRLDFATPIHELLLAGHGFLESIRIPAATPIPLTPEIRVLSALTPPTPLVDAPLPDPPLFATVRNLQQPQPVSTVDQPAQPMPAPHELGFEVRWRPAPRAGIAAWPPNLTAPPPLDAALFQIEHRQVAPTVTPFAPVIDADDNHVLGDRSYGSQTPPIHPGVDLLTVFPEVRPTTAGAADLFWQDVFDFTEDGGQSVDLPRPLPPPGTRHQYRVRAVDPIGRPSATWVETGTERLEKHTAPPLPASPDPTAADALVEPAVTGVRARVLLAGASDLTDDERAILGGHGSAIVLTWGWHDQQRRQDPFAREFRMYSSVRVPGRVRATILGVVALGGDRFDAALQGDRPFGADAARGTVIEAGAQFRVLGHGPGPTATLELRALERDVGATPIAPVTGAIELPIRVTPDQTRAPFWGPRVAIEPIDSRTVYSHTFFDLFDLSPDHPRDTVHVGVSAADGQAYVPDPLAPASTRAGNESPIVGVPCEGRWLGRPVVVETASLAPVPVIVTPEPAARALTFPLNLAPHAPFPPSALVRPERVSDDAVFRAYRVESGRVIARVLDEPAPGETEEDVVVPNAADRAAIIAALSGASAGLEDRFVVFLASVHPHRARLFQAATREPVRVDRFEETLPNRGARWVYRLRLADAAGRLSEGAPTLPVIVRVPATTALAPPMRVERHPSRLVLRISATSEVTELLVFARSLTSRAPPPDEAELLRIASATGPAVDRVRLRLPDGTLIAPAVKSLADADVVHDGPFRLVTVDAPANGLVRVWASSATRDGVVSAPGGPWRLGG